MEPVNKSPDLLIVSAYGRGHWLAAELARKDWSVHLVDVTGALGEWAPEDWEGPWGFFDTPELAPSQLVDDGHAHPVSEGFTIWLPQGPLELDGELAAFLEHSFGIHEHVRAYLRPPPASASKDVVPQGASRLSGAPRESRSPAGPSSPTAPIASPSPAALWFDALRPGGVRRPSPLRGRERLHKKVAALTFEAGWLAHFAHSAAGLAYAENHEALSHGAPLPLKAPYVLRHVTKDSFEAGLQALEKLGVRVTRGATVNDVRIHNKVMDALEIAAGRRGVDSARLFVWTLSSGESGFLSEDVMRAVYPGGALQPAWLWSRYRFRLLANAATRALPAGLAIVDNVCLPWTHSNCMMVRRLRSEDQSENRAEKKAGGRSVGEATTGEARAEEVKVDIWIRVPSRASGDKAYFEALRAEISAILARRLPLSAPECEALPAESDAGAAAGRAARWPVFSAEELGKLEICRAKNLIVDGPELWDGHDWMSQMRSQRAVLAALEKLRLQWQAAERREGAHA